MYPIAVATGSLLGMLVALVVLLSIAASHVYVPANDVFTKLFTSVGFLKPPADGLEHLILKFEPDDEYPAGGYTTLGLLAHATGSLAVLGLSEIVHVQVSTTAGGYHGTYNPATGKIMVFRTKDPANAGGADLPLQEVAAAVDLSAQDFYLHVWGKRDSTV